MPLALMGMFYFDPLYLMIFIPIMLLSLAASGWVKSAYNTWSKVRNAEGLTGAEAARKILRAQGIDDVPVQEVPGQLSDNYDPGKRIVHLSSDVFHGDSLAAVGVAAHEVGHAIQHAHQYAPLMLRRVMAPAVMLGQGFYMLLFIIGGVLLYGGNAQWGTWLILGGLACLAGLVLFSLITLPVEFDASFRAMNQLRTLAILREDELIGVRKVLTAAAMTYVVGAISAIATLVYFLLRFSGRRD
ncbi:MAG TPA: zinc metallopeptidase [Planctomycetota bacterium]|nr:zinc metallopeptidase [Planctomycetota bacterium]